MRFDFNANTHSKATEYILNRAVQLLKYGVRLIRVQEVDFGIDATFVYDGQEYHGIYVFERYRGRGLYLHYLRQHRYKIVTHLDCQIEEYLKKHRVTHICFGAFERTYEYMMMQDFYADQKANRSGVHLMNHVDEGLAVLSWIYASEVAMKAYTLHPLFQSDDDFLRSYNNYPFKSKQLDPRVLMSLIEYRSVANEYLSNKPMSDWQNIRLSPVKDINDMLVADKVQNCKDFELYHKGTHARSNDLSIYFENWLRRLNSFERYPLWKRDLTVGV
jgi:hypothetical protein